MPRCLSMGALPAPPATSCRSIWRHRHHRLPERTRQCRRSRAPSRLRAAPFPAWRVVPRAPRAVLFPHRRHRAPARRSWRRLGVFGWKPRSADGDVCGRRLLRVLWARKLRLAAGANVRVLGETNAYRYQPRGVGVASPWNFPSLFHWDGDGGARHGNTVVFGRRSRRPASRCGSSRSVTGLPPGFFLPAGAGEVGPTLPSTRRRRSCRSRARATWGCRWSRRRPHPSRQRHVKRVVARWAARTRSSSTPTHLMWRSRDVASVFGYAGQKCLGGGASSSRRCSTS